MDLLIDCNNSHSTKMCHYPVLNDIFDQLSLKQEIQNYLHGERVLFVETICSDILMAHWHRVQVRTRSLNGRKMFFSELCRGKTMVAYTKP